MRLKTEFIQLPVRFDTELLMQEVLALPDSAWYAHHQGYQGNSALVLVSPGGEQNNNHVGEMQCTDALKQCPYIQQVLASFNSVIGRSRLMRLDPGSEVPPHFDVNLSWRHRVRIHIPIITDPQVVFSSIGNIDVHMRSGEAWIFDNWQTHAVYNRSQTRRIHLVIDTLGSSEFWKLAESGQDPRHPQANWSDSIRQVEYEPDKPVVLECEKFNQKSVYSADQMSLMLSELTQDLTAWRSAAPQEFAEFSSEVDAFLQDWRSQWSLYADTVAGLPHYSSLQRRLNVSAKRLLGDACLDSNQAPAIEVLTRWLAATVDTKAVTQATSFKAVTGVQAGVDTSLFDSPIFIVAAPRSGSTLLFESLQENMELWTLGDESHQVFESIKALHPATKQFESNALTAQDCSGQVGAALIGGFMRRLRNSRGTLFSQIPPETQGSNLRFLEKTPKNALRIPFLRELFPNAIFLYLHRQPEANIGSIIDAWNSGKFVTYPNLPGWSGPPWSLLLPEQWRRFDGRPLAEIAAWQWAHTNQKIINDLSDLPGNRWHRVDYQDFLDNREDTLQGICQFADIPFGPKMQALARQALPNSKYTLSEPKPDKWKRHQIEIDLAFANLPEVEQVRQLINALAPGNES